MKVLQMQGPTSDRPGRAGSFSGQFLQPQDKENSWKVGQEHCKVSTEWAFLPNMRSQKAGREGSGDFWQGYKGGLVIFGGELVLVCGLGSGPSTCGLGSGTPQIIKYIFSMLTIERFNCFWNLFEDSASLFQWTQTGIFYLVCRVNDFLIFTLGFGRGIWICWPVLLSCIHKGLGFHFSQSVF